MDATGGLMPAPGAKVSESNLDQLAINTIRTLSMDAVQQANSGHPGAPMGLAPLVYCLWQRFLRYDPEDPAWFNRDRFVLSAGHASMLLYATLHLAGVRRLDGQGRVMQDLAVPMEEIKRFRQLDSKTPGHPESHITTGVETTTGPLGQGAGNSVGMAIASKWLAANFNRPSFEIFDFNVYAVCGDGDLMEGVSGEAASLAGHLRLSNLCWIYDNNRVTLDGPAAECFGEGIGKRGGQLRAQWMKLFGEYAKQFPELAGQIARMQRSELPDGWDKNLPVFPADAKDIATRESSGKTLNALAKNIPWLIGGSADLAKSNKTNLTFDGAGDFYPDQYRGRNIHFGVREHAMGAIVNGMTLTKLRAFSATFFNFSDYMRPNMRLGALMEIPAIYIFTHDSIGVGEDGPTHQPIEQLASLRAMPNMLILRPGDANEVVEAYKVILQHTHGPASLVLTRQAIPTFDRTKYAPASGVAKGAYVLADAPGGKPDVILMASGSELSLCAEAYEKLKTEGIKARVASMPSWELFERQETSYKDSVRPANVTARVSVEMATTFGWERYTGTKGKIIGMRSFGASAPLKDLLKKFGFESDKVVTAAREVLGK